MSSNAIGTVLRILLIAFGLIVIWYLPVYVAVVIISYIFDFDIGLNMSLILFAIVMIYRMFFPKNVFCK